MGVRDKWDSYRLYDDVSIFKKTFSMDLGQGQAITDIVCPLTIMTDTWDNWDDPSSIASDVWGLRVLVAVGDTPGGNSTVLRLEPNTNGITLVSAIEIPVGGGGDLTYLLTCNPAATSAWDAGGVPTIGGGGWLRVRLGGNDRWIQLYAIAP